MSAAPDKYCDHFFEHPLPHTLPAAVLERPASESIRTIEQWRALGRRRRSIFGVTAAMVRQIDQAVAEARTR